MGHVPVSSLIFVVIVAIWAAYLVQHWARRREDAAASRSVEGFSEAMRVLEKRPALPATELRTPRPHSYAVKPATVARPTVDVKRAVPAGTARRHSPLVARRSNHEPSQSHQSQTHPSQTHQSQTEHDIAPYAAEVDRMPESARQSSPHAPRRHRPAAAPARVPLAQRRLRAVLLLLAVAWLPVSITLSVTGVLMWVSVPFAVLTIVAVLVWLRAEARADRLRTASSAPAESHRDDPGARGEGRRRRRRRHGDEGISHPPVLSTEDTQVIRSAAVAVEAEALAPAGPALSTSAPAAEPGVFDVQAQATGEVPVTAAQPQEAPEGSWSPVPVPLPTYALKAKAEPRYTDGGIPADVFDTPEFADEAEELDDRALFARRAVSQ